MTAHDPAASPAARRSSAAAASRYVCSESARRSADVRNHRTLAGIVSMLAVAPIAGVGVVATVPPAGAHASVDPASRRQIVRDGNRSIIEWVRADARQSHESYMIEIAWRANDGTRILNYDLTETAGSLHVGGEIVAPQPTKSLWGRRGWRGAVRMGTHRDPERDRSGLSRSIAVQIRVPSFALARESRQPPLPAGTIVIVAPSSTRVSSPSRNAML